MQLILYSLVIFLATALGATTGAGGGAVIKPVLDLLGMDTAPTISVYSTVAVFSMCLTSIYKHSQKGLTFNWKILASLSLGSLLGGILGEIVFKTISETFSNQKVTLIQSALLFGVLFLVLLFTRFHQNLPKYHLTHPILIFGLGGLVGSLSVFLGIGGGPLNIIVLMGFLGFSSKESTPYSLAIIFFAQIPKIITLLFNTQEVTYNLWLVPLIALTAILGGTVGTRFNQKMTDQQVSLAYSAMMAGLLLICFINIMRNLG